MKRAEQDWLVMVPVQVDSELQVYQVEAFRVGAATSLSALARARAARRDPSGRPQWSLSLILPWRRIEELADSPVTTG